MSKYTTELRYICEEQANRDTSGEYTDIASIIAAARPKIFSFDYPYYSEAQKEKTETNILRHFYTREISEEVYGLWKLRLEDRLNLIMPYYVDLFRSADLEFNPLNDVNYTETMDQDTSSEGRTTTSGETTGSVHDVTTATTDTDDDTTNVDHREDTTGVTRDVTDDRTTHISETDVSKYSDTPQGSITDLSDDTYLTNARIDTKTANNTDGDVIGETSTTTFETDDTLTSNRDIHTETDGELTRETSGTSSSEMNSNDSGELNYEKTVVGKTGGKSYSELLTAYRNTILRIDSMICDELEDLFMLLW